MRIGVLGAGGDVGGRIATALAVDGASVVGLDVDSSTLTDLSGYDVETAALDVTAADAPERLRSLGLDAVVSAVGPFYRFGERTLDVAIEAGLPYLDVCDDHDAIVAQLARDEAAGDAGVLAIVGCGWTPGISNLLATHAANGIDGPVVVEIDWIGSAADSRGLAVVEHVLHVTSGPVPQYRDGRRVEATAGTSPRPCTVPEVGRVRTRICGHPEPVTLPQHVDARSVVVRGGLVVDWQNRLLAGLATLGLTRTGARRRRLARLLHRVEAAFRVGSVPLSGVVVTVSGVGGSRTLAAVGRMTDLTGRTAAIGVRTVLEGCDSPPGVYPPEAVFEPAPLLETLATDEIRFYECPDRNDGGAWSRLDGFD